MRRINEPTSQEQALAALPNQLESLVQDRIVNRNEHGYKLNPFHPLHSRVMPDGAQAQLVGGEAGPSTSINTNQVNFLL